MTLFELSKKFPREEMCSLTDQCHRSSRWCLLTVAWRKRCYEGAFVDTIGDFETEVAEKPTWL